MDCGDVGDLFGLPDRLLAIEDILGFGGAFVCDWICGDVANGSDQYDRAKSGAGSIAKPGDGGVRDDVHGSAADRVVAGGRRGATSRRAKDAGDIRIIGSGGEPDFCVSSGNTAAADS